MKKAALKDRDLREAHVIWNPIGGHPEDRSTFRRYKFHGTEKAGYLHYFSLKQGFVGKI